jgi:hypothetical protein
MYLLIFETGESLQREIMLFATQPVDRLAGSTRWLVKSAPWFSCARANHKLYPLFHTTFGGGDCTGLRMIIDCVTRRIIFREDAGPLWVIPRRRGSTRITAGTYAVPPGEREEALY